MTSVLPAVLGRELRLLGTDRESAVVTVTFVVAAVVLAGLAFGPEPATLIAVGPGTIWLVTVLSAAPQAREVAAAERDEGAWDLLRGLLRPTDLLISKVAGLWLRLTTTWALTALLVAAIFGLQLPPRAWAAGVLGTLGLAILLVALGVMVSGVRNGGSALLTALVLPLCLPILLAGTMLTTPGLPAGPWFVVLAGVDLVLLATVWGTFPVLLEE